jgi:uncharacterized protein YukE
MADSSSFAADPAAISACATAFDNETDPIAQVAQQLDGLKGTGATAGRDYTSAGNSYHQTVTTELGKLIREFSEKTEWMSAALSTTASDYQSTDTGNASALTTSGSGT